MVEAKVGASLQSTPRSTTERQGAPTEVNHDGVCGRAAAIAKERGDGEAIVDGENRPLQLAVRRAARLACTRHCRSNVSALSRTQPFFIGFIGSLVDAMSGPSSAMQGTALLSAFIDSRAD